MQRLMLAPRLRGLVACLALGAQAQNALAEPWRQYADPAQVGFSQDRLEVAYKLADAGGSAAVMAVYRGHVLLAWGNVERRFELASARKSLVSALVGTQVGARIDLSKTLAELGIDDEPPLTNDEKRATVRDLISARSGVYHSAAKETPDMKRNRPARGSRKPGENFWYNNWDFNTIGTIVERCTFANLYEEFERQVARPLAMQDYHAAEQFAEFEPSHSVHQAHAFQMSARDMARVGQLYLQRGKWDDNVVLSPEWIAESTVSHSDFSGGDGYGYMWSIYPPGTPARWGNLDAVKAAGKFAANGAGGQWVIVIPSRELVFVNLADTNNNQQVDDREVWRMVEAILDAGPAGAPTSPPRLAPMSPRPFSRELPPPKARQSIPIDRAQPNTLVGEYESDSDPKRRLRLFMHQDRMFANNMSGFETELFAESPDAFFSKAEDIQVLVERGPGAKVKGMVMTLRGQPARMRPKQ